MNIMVENTLDYVGRIFKQLEQSSSKKDKQQIIMSHRDNSAFKQAVFYALNPRYSYYIKTIPDATRDSTLDQVMDQKPTTVDQATDVLDQLRTREVSGNAAHELVESFRASLNPIEDDVLVRMLSKNLRIGATIKSFNAIWGSDFITETPCIKAREFNDKNIANIKWPAYAQTKFDGTRMIAIKLDGKINLITRNGSLFTNLEVIEQDVAEILSEAPDRSFVDGELVFINNETGQPLPRKKSNGFATRSIKGTLPDSARDQMGMFVPKLFAWDMWRADKADKPYGDRLDELTAKVGQRAQLVDVVQTHSVADMEEANVLYRAQRAAGEEGLILKNIDSYWENTRSKHLVKMKAFKEADLRIVELREGDKRSKNENRLGRVACQSDDGLIEVLVGSGYTSNERDALWKDRDSLVGKIITVKYNDVVEDDNKPGVYSLYIPSFIEIRHDKDETNTLEEIQKVKTA